MKFKICRTSSWNDNESPCEEATMVKTEDQRLDRTGEYRIHYEIEINTLEELIELSKKYGQFILSEDTYDDNFFIEIYDDYRE